MTAHAPFPDVASHVDPSARGSMCEVSMSISTRTISGCEKARTNDIRKSSAKVWQAFLHDNFANMKQVQQAFHVDERTSSNWWHGRNAPGLWVVQRSADVPGLGKALARTLGLAA